MIILGIETSCDETAAAVVKDGTKILSNVIASSVDMHAKTGGIIPEQAARQQVKSIIPVVSRALFDAFKNSTPRTQNSKQFDYSLITMHQSSFTKVDAIAVTVGPGLIGSLLVGVETAKTLSYLWNKPIVPLNHLVGHIYANWLEIEKPKFPALVLVVSGGHTDLVLMTGHGKLKWIGGTKDDAAGEAFDKTAKLLGLPYPGGPAISAAAKKFQIPKSPPCRQEGKFQMKMFPRPMANEKNFDWSFSGLKTAVLKETKKLKKLHSRRADGKAEKLSAKKLPQLAAEIQEAIVDSLINKTINAIKEFRPRSFLLAGGVAANTRLQEKLRKRIECEKINVEFHVPPAALCTDNAAFIASCAFFNYKSLNWKKIDANPQLTITGET